MSNLIEIKNLSKSFGKKLALDNINLQLDKGKIIGILGENGAGKTTLLKIIAGIYKSKAENITINGQAVSDKTHKYVSYMPDEYALFEWMKVKDAINYYRDMYDDFDVKKAETLCQNMKINKNDKVKTLSKGMKERVMIMLVFARNTTIYLLDEPIGGIDPLAKDLILKTVISNVNENSIVLLSTHLVKDIEHILDEVIFIKDGKILIKESSNVIGEEKHKTIEEYYLEVMKDA